MNLITNGCMSEGSVDVLVEDVSNACARPSPRDSRRSLGYSRPERRRSSDPLSALPHSEELGVKAFNGFQETQKKEKRRFLEDVREHLEMQLGVSKKVFGHLDIQEELEQRQDLYGKMRYKVHLMLKDQKFDAFIGVVIVINSACLGLESSFSLDPTFDTSIFATLEWVFAAIYIVELALRLFAHGLQCLASPWVQFDAVLVGLSILSMFSEPDL